MRRTDRTHNWTRRLAEALTGLALVTLGAGGIGYLLSAPAAGVADESARTESARTEPGTDTHELMHEMMDAMHGEGTAERMHEVEGVDEMMGRCTTMMDAMDGMMGGRGMMDGMMDHRGMMDRMMRDR